MTWSVAALLDHITSMLLSPKLTGSHSRSASATALNVMVGFAASGAPVSLSRRYTVPPPPQATSRTPPTTLRPVAVQPTGAAKLNADPDTDAPEVSKWKI